MNIYTLYYIDLRNINTEDLFKKLLNAKIEESYLNDITFCPYLIIHKDFETNTHYVYENINEGYLNMIKSKCIAIEDNDINSFINHINESDNNNRLF